MFVNIRDFASGKRLRAAVEKHEIAARTPVVTSVDAFIVAVVNPPAIVKGGHVGAASAELIEARLGIGSRDATEGPFVLIAQFAVHAVPGVNVKFFARAFGDVWESFGALGIDTGNRVRKVNLGKARGATENGFCLFSAGVVSGLGRVQITAVGQNGRPGFLIRTTAGGMDFGGEEFVLMLIGIDGHGDVDLSEVAQASGDPSSLFTATQSRQEQSRENRNDSDHHKQFDESKCRWAFLSCFHFVHHSERRARTSKSSSLFCLRSLELTSS